MKTDNLQFMLILFFEGETFFLLQFSYVSLLIVNQFSHIEKTFI